MVVRGLIDVGEFIIVVAGGVFSVDLCDIVVVVTFGGFSVVIVGGFVVVVALGGFVIGGFVVF